MSVKYDVNQLAEQYEARRAAREGRMRRVLEGREGFLVMQCVGRTFYNNCNTIEAVVQENLASFAASVALEWTDDLPYLEPWIGTGVYANAFGCEYVWREGESPACHYRYHRMEELDGVEEPRWQDSPVMRMVLEAIERLKEATGGRIPIALTDTQSPFDTATLIMDAAEFFTACYVDRERVQRFMRMLTDLLIEFSREQERVIGEGLVARPGHIMPSGTFLRGISISDDNLAVSSPHINEAISLPYNQEIAEAFGGLAIHSCGEWTKTMALLKDKCPGVIMIDCAASREADPNPNELEAIREALAGTGIVAKVRIGKGEEELRAVAERLADERLPLVVEIPYEEGRAERNYKQAWELLARVYGG